MRLAVLLSCLLLATADPAGAAEAALPVEEVAPGVFVHVGAHEDFTAGNAGAIANIGFVIGEEAVAVVDTGGSPGEGRRLRAAIARRTDLPVRWIIATHGHPDHVFGNVAFADSDPHIVGHERLAREMAEKGPAYLDNMRRLLGPASEGTAVVPPDRGVPPGSTFEIDLGGRVLRLDAWPTAHTAADLTALDVESGTLFAGDLLFMERLPVVDGSLLGWLAVMDRLETLPARQVVPGHGPARADWPAALGPQRRYLEALRDMVRAAIADGMGLAEASAGLALPEGPAWLLSEENHPRNVIASYTELEWE